MKKLFTLSVLFFLFFSVLLSGCSQEDKQPQAESKNVSEKMAEKIEKNITTPLDKALTTRNLGEERTEAIDRALEEQPGK